MAPRFSIRLLLCVVAVFAMCAWMVRTSDWMAGLGLGLSAMVLLLVVKLPTARLGLQLTCGIRFVGLLVGGVIAWFSIVDSSGWAERCSHCTDHRYATELRLCGIAVFSECVAYHADPVSRLRTDLGMPCNHEFERWHIVRKWGLFHCARPCFGGTCCLIGDPDYYNDDLSRQVREFAANHPEDAVDLCKRVVDSKDYDAMHAFIARMKGLESEGERYPSLRAAEQADTPTSD